MGSISSPELLMRISPRFRTCPECGQRGVETAEIHPNGIACVYCQKQIETDTTFTILLIVTLIAVMLLDLHYYHSGVVGYLCAALLFIFGGPIKWSHATFLRLRHYETDGTKK